MLNIHITDRYIAAYDLLLEDDSFTEEVVVEASIEPFHLTCSIGHDQQGQYVTWNLRYYNAFIEHKTTRAPQAFAVANNDEQLMHETSYKFRQMLVKAANRNGHIAQIAREQLAKL